MDCSWRQLLTLIFLVPTISCIQPAGTQPSAQIQEAVKPSGVLQKPFFWRIEKQQKSCFLVGTMHLGIDAKVELPPDIWRALNSATLYVSEHDGRKRSPLAGKKGSEVDQLSASLSETAWFNLLEALSPMTKDDINQLSPGRAAFIYQFALLSKELPSDLPSMDLQLLNEAEQHEKKLGFLESAADAEHVIDQTVATISELEAMLVRDEDEFGKELGAQFTDLLKVYRSGNLGQVEDVLIEQMGTRNYEQIIARRNQSWMVSIASHLNNGNCFIAVGVGHLVGPDSLITLLKEQGHKVERLDP